MHINEPDFWLVFESEGGLEAVASTDLPADDADDRFLAGVAHGFHEAHQGRRLIFMSDLTRWLASAGLDWGRLDIDLAALASHRSCRAAVRPSQRRDETLSLRTSHRRLR